MSKILIVDDEHEICKILSARFKRMGHDVSFSLSLQQGIEKLFSDEFDVVFLDVSFPDGNGLQAIETIQEHPFAPEIIIMTGASDPQGAEFAMKAKAWDYIEKTGSYKEFKFSLIRALEYRQQKHLTIERRAIKRGAIIGESRPIKTCLKNVSKAANNDTPVLITGETGTGKELFAKAIHENSQRHNNAFIVVDCAALPEHLVESILFGYSKGAFTGADADKPGLIKLADRGTLFLDEVGELPLGIQKRFLRALQEKRFRPVGGKNEVSSDFRLVAATHRNMHRMVELGKIRKDFYFRIASIKIGIPPLRSRKNDIPLLTTFHLDRKSRILNENPHELSSEFMDNLYGYNWPGNVRELFNTIDYACSDAYQEKILFPRHLPDYIRTFNLKKKIKKVAGDKVKSGLNDMQPGFAWNKIDMIPSLRDHIEMVKCEYIKNILLLTNWNIKESCRISGLSRGHLYRLIQKFDLKQ